MKVFGAVVVLSLALVGCDSVDDSYFAEGGILTKDNIKDYCAADNAENEIYAEFTRQFGSGAEDNIAVGTILITEKITPVSHYHVGYKSTSQEESEAMLASITRLPVGTEMEIIERYGDPVSRSFGYRVKLPAYRSNDGNVAEQWVNSIALMWYNTKERNDAHSDLGTEWRKPRKKAIKDKWEDAYGDGSWDKVWDESRKTNPTTELNMWQAYCNN